MLGSALYAGLKDNYDLTLTIRDQKKIKLLENAYGAIDKRHRVVSFDILPIYKDFEAKKGFPGRTFENFLKELADIDFAINAIGITIPFALENPALTFFINSAFPFIIANTFGSRLIHVTTDCVYNGKEGFPYKEDSQKTPLDIYGFSKSLGEPANCLTLRTSIIGRELESFTGLLEWFRQQGGREIKGFSNHFWNGLTTNEFAKVCDKIFSNRKSFPATGIYHVFSNAVSKYEMLLALEEKYKIGAKITANDSQFLNRTLSTKFDLNSKLKNPSFSEMIKEL